MVIYEVHLSVEPNVARAFRAWLEHHISEMLLIDGFLSAEILQPFDLSEPSPEAEEPIEFVTHYRLRDRESLENYLEEQAPAMRREGIDRFGDSFRAHRRFFQSTRQFVR